MCSHLQPSTVHPGLAGQPLLQTAVRSAGHPSLPASLEAPSPSPPSTRGQPSVLTSVCSPPAPPSMHVSGLEARTGVHFLRAARLPDSPRPPSPSVQLSFRRLHLDGQWTSRTWHIPHQLGLIMGTDTPLRPWSCLPRARPSPGCTGQNPGAGAAGVQAKTASEKSTPLSSCAEAPRNVIHQRRNEADTRYSGGGP